MAFAVHCGIDADIATLGDDRLAALFNEELGAVIQVPIDLYTKTEDGKQWLATHVDGLP